MTKQTKSKEKKPEKKKPTIWALYELEDDAHVGTAKVQAIQNIELDFPTVSEALKALTPEKVKEWGIEGKFHIARLWGPFEVVEEKKVKIKRPK